MELTFIILAGKTCVICNNEVKVIDGYANVLTFVKTMVFDFFKAHEVASAISVKASKARMVKDEDLRYFTHCFN